MRKELHDFKPELSEKPEIIILTKTDITDSTNIKKLIETLKKISKKVVPVSIHDYQSLEELKKVLMNI